MLPVMGLGVRLIQSTLGMINTLWRTWIYDDFSPFFCHFIAYTVVRHEGLMPCIWLLVSFSFGRLLVHVESYKLILGLM